MMILGLKDGSYIGKLGLGGFYMENPRAKIILQFLAHVSRHGILCFESVSRHGFFSSNTGRDVATRISLRISVSRHQVQNLVKTSFFRDFFLRDPPLHLLNSKMLRKTFLTPNCSYLLRRLQNTKTRTKHIKRH